MSEQAVDEQVAVDHPEDQQRQHQRLDRSACGRCPGRSGPGACGRGSSDDHRIQTRVATNMISTNTLVRVHQPVDAPAVRPRRRGAGRTSTRVHRGCALTLRAPAGGSPGWPPAATDVGDARSSPPTQPAARPARARPGWRTRGRPGPPRRQVRQHASAASASAVPRRRVTGTSTWRSRPPRRSAPRRTAPAAANGHQHRQLAGPRLSSRQVHEDTAAPAPPWPAPAAPAPAISSPRAMPGT